MDDRTWPTDDSVAATSQTDEVNNGTDGTDPTISTWYWQPTSC